MSEEPPNRILQIERIVIIGSGIVLSLIVIGICLFFWAVDVGMSKQLEAIQFFATFDSVQTSVEETPCLIFSVQNKGDVPIKLMEVVIIDARIRKNSLFIPLSRGKECSPDQGETQLQPGEEEYFSAYVKSVEKMEAGAEIYVTACLLVHSPPLCADTKAKVIRF